MFVLYVVTLARAGVRAHAPGAFDISIEQARARDLDAARMLSELLARGSITLPRESGDAPLSLLGMGSD